MKKASWVFLTVLVMVLTFHTLAVPASAEEGQFSEDTAGDLVWSEEENDEVSFTCMGEDALTGGTPMGDALPGDVLPGDALPGDALPDDALPGDALPDDTLPGDALADDFLTDEILPDDLFSDDIIPVEESVSNDTPSFAENDDEWNDDEWNDDEWNDDEWNDDQSDDEQWDNEPNQLYDLSTLKVFVRSNGSVSPLKPGQKVQSGDSLCCMCVYTEDGTVPCCLEYVLQKEEYFGIFGIYEGISEAAWTQENNDPQWTDLAESEYPDLKEGEFVEINVFPVSSQVPDGIYRLYYTELTEEGCSSELDGFSVEVTGNKKTGDHEPPELVSLTFDKAEYRADENLTGTLVFKEATCVSDMLITMSSTQKDECGEYKEINLTFLEEKCFMADEDGLVTIRFSFEPSLIGPYSYENNPTYKVKYIYALDEHKLECDDGDEDRVIAAVNYYNTEALQPFTEYDPESDYVVPFTHDAEITLTAFDSYQWSSDEIYIDPALQEPPKQKGSANWLNVSGTLPMKVRQKYKGVKVSGLAAGDHVRSVVSGKPKVVSVSFNKKTGVLTLKAKKKGKSRITVTLASGQKKFFIVKVQNKKVRTKRIDLRGTGSVIRIKKGARFKLQTVLSPVTSQDKIKYSSSDRKAATVSKKGVVTAKRAGTVKITIKSGKKKKVVTVKVQ